MGFLSSEGLSRVCIVGEKDKKLFVLYHYGYDESFIIGVFDTYEKAYTAGTVLIHTRFGSRDEIFRPFIVERILNKTDIRDDM